METYLNNTILIADAAYNDFIMLLDHDLYKVIENADILLHNEICATCVFNDTTIIISTVLSHEIPGGIYKDKILTLNINIKHY